MFLTLFCSWFLCCLGYIAQCHFGRTVTAYHLVQSYVSHDLIPLAEPGEWLRAADFTILLKKKKSWHSGVPHNFKQTKCTLYGLAHKTAGNLALSRTDHRKWSKKTKNNWYPLAVFFFWVHHGLRPGCWRLSSEIHPPSRCQSVRD